jgi:hypothetical protein
MTTSNNANDKATLTALVAEKQKEESAVRRQSKSEKSK